MASKTVKTQLDNRNPHKNDDLIKEVLESEEEIGEEEDDPENDEEEIDEEDAGAGATSVQKGEKEEDEDTDDELDEEEIDEETGEPKKKVVTKEKKTQEPPDDAERLAAQRREATILHARNKQLTDAFSKVGEVKEPTEQELQTAAETKGYQWDELTTFEKDMFKENFVNKQKLSAVDGAMKGVKDIDEWGKSVDTFLDENERDQKDKSLIGKESAFREFAMRESHRGVAMPVLVSAFLHDTGGTKVKRSNNGSIMLTKTGGEKVERKNNLADGDYIASLRKSNPKEYARLAKAGKINIEI